MNEKTRQIQYIYVDVVKFTQKRTIEAQASVISSMNSIVKSAIEANRHLHDEYILLPTGDGLAICIVAPENYDIGIKLSLQILHDLNVYNLANPDSNRSFQIRIGINQNVDNIITDIYGRTNVAGRGVNQAHRIMSCADGMQIIIGASVYDILCEREEFIDCFTKFHTVDKHGNQFDCFQLTSTEFDYLNIKTPAKFVKNIKPAPQMPDELAFAIALAQKHREFLLSKKKEIYYVENANILVYLLALDALDNSRRGPHDSEYFRIKGEFNNVWNSINESFRPISNQLNSIIDNSLESFSSNFEKVDYQIALFLPTSNAVTEIREKRPKIWRIVFPEV